MQRYVDSPKSTLENILLQHLLPKPGEQTGVKARGKTGVFSLPACCWHRPMPSTRQSRPSLRKAIRKDWLLPTAPGMFIRPLVAAETSQPTNTDHISLCKQTHCLNSQKPGIIFIKKKFSAYI